MKVDQNVICSFQIIKSNTKIEANQKIKKSKYAT
jgi:hypothetical protein